MTQPADRPRIQTTPSLRIDLGSDCRIGPGKIALLRAIEVQGSIRAASETLGLSYPKASRLARELGQTPLGPLLQTRAGGADRGGAQLTEAGHSVIRAYEAANMAARKALSAHLR